MMKFLLTTLSILTTFFSFSQLTRSELTGIWILTDYNAPEKFDDTWEFTSEGIFNELKHKADGDTTLVPDENGTWKLENNELEIKVTGEETRGEQVLYKTPQIMTFLISRDGDDFVLEVIKDGGASDGKTIKLRLTRK